MRNKIDMLFCIQGLLNALKLDIESNKAMKNRYKVILDRIKTINDEFININKDISKIRESQEPWICINKEKNQETFSQLLYAVWNNDVKYWEGATCEFPDKKEQWIPLVFPSYQSAIEFIEKTAENRYIYSVHEFISARTFETLLLYIG